jgi:heme oxygenase
MTQQPALRRLARDALRGATDAIHQRLHRHALLQRLADGSISRSGYIALLNHFLAFHATIEDRLGRGPDLAEHGIDLAERRRSPLLLSDLALLGAPATIAPPPVLRTLPVPGSAAAAIGYLYVSEGSRMGGLALARSLDGLLAPGSVAGRSFLLGYGPRHGAMWRDLCDTIERVGAADECRGAMISAALRAFSVFESCIEARSTKLAESA